jgi:hypothetical protein
LVANVDVIASGAAGRSDESALFRDMHQAKMHG